MEIITEYVNNKKQFLLDEIKKIKEPLKLVIVQINDDPASNAYIKGKLKDLAEIGTISELLKLDINITMEELKIVIDKLNNDPSVTGFIVQMPLPKQLNEEIIKDWINPDKDVDGFNSKSLFKPATPNGIITYLKDNNFDFDGKNALIIGRSNIVGKPMAKLLLNLNMNVTITHSYTSKEDLEFYLKHADLIVVAVGKPYFINKTFRINKNAVIFDVGINRIDGKLVGDCEPDLDVKFLSPVPRGVGLLTRLSLLLNLMEAYKNGI